jgi:cellobiose epimerase
MKTTLDDFAASVENELSAIMYYWQNFTVDTTHAGFYGSVDNNNLPDSNAIKGVVLHARILWSFSATCNYSGQTAYLPVAERAFDYIEKYFIDREFGGAYWSLDAKGNITDGRKQIYALAFCIYGMSEYFAATKNQIALEEAIRLFQCIEQNSYDPANKGYFEAFSREWGALDDFRLSSKDANEKKTMNTHLHVVEAYANLYKVWPDAGLKEKISELLQLFITYFINTQTFHLKLFFDEQWQEKPDVISYGHDIESAWLLQQCAEIIDDTHLITRLKQYAIHITNAAMEGIDTDGGMWYEYNPVNNELIQEKHWWPQAEAMVGLFNAYQITKNEQYLHACLKNWQFIQAHIIDKQNGEWFWGVFADNRIMPNQDKAGFWKCPYHNSRACIELLQRIKLMA